MSEHLSVRDAVRVPSLLSLSRIGLGAVFPLVAERPRRALAVLALAGATDVLDGWYARHFHQASATGAMLDGLTDKVFVLTVAFTLVARGALSPLDVALLGARDVGELVLAARLHAGHLPALGKSANVGGKVTTLLQYAAVVAVLRGWRHRGALVGAAALAGMLATVSYWRRDVSQREASQRAVSQAPLADMQRELVVLTASPHLPVPGARAEARLERIEGRS